MANDLRTHFMSGQQQSHQQIDVDKELSFFVYRINVLAILIIIMLISYFHILTFSKTQKNFFVNRNSTSYYI